MDACGPGGINGISWNWGAEPDLGSGKGPCLSPLRQPGSCRFKAISVSKQWDIGCINGGSGFGSWMSCDYYAVIGKDKRAISGEVRTKRGKGVSGATITIDGPTGGRVQTNPDGSFYADNLDPGQYRASMLANGRHEAITFCSGHEQGGTCFLDLTSNDGQADFTAPPDRLALHFSPGQVFADGVSNFTGTADVTDSVGQPAPGTDVVISPVDANLRALVCSGGKVIWPQVLNDGTPIDSPIADRTLTTDSNGQIPLSVWAGTVPGDLLTEASETADSSVKDSVRFPLEASNQHFPPLDGFAQLFYNAIRSTQSQTSVKVFMQFNKNLSTPEGDTQDILLEWLIASGRMLFPGADFGPVSYADHAGILFYPHGSTTPTAGPTVVLDVRDAVQIAIAASDGTAIPPVNAQARSLADWAMYVSGSQTPPPLVQTLGPLKPWTGQQYAYFGFPYPRSPLDAPGQAQFYNSCSAPDGTPQIVQTHSPVSLVFSAPDGTTFGLNAQGQVTGSGTGIVWRAGGVTTYLVPAGRYTAMSITGTGNGTAHIDVFGVVSAPLTSYARQISNYVLRAHAGVTGTLPVNFFGPAGAMSYAGRIVKAQAGLPIQLFGLPAKFRHGKRKLKLTATSFGTGLQDALVTISYKGHQLHATTNGHGHASFSINPPRGKLTITVSYPGAATLVSRARVT